MEEKKGIVCRLNWFGDVLEKIFNFFVVIFLIGVALAVSVLVLGREINIPVVWLDELSTYAVVWLVFFGMALGYKKGQFPRVDVICVVIPKRFHPYMEIFWDVIGAVILSLILWSGKDYILHAYNSGTTSAQLRIPLYIVYCGPVIGYLFTLYFTIVNIVNKIAAICEKKGAEDK